MILKFFGSLLSCVSSAALPEHSMPFEMWLLLYLLSHVTLYTQLDFDALLPDCSHGQAPYPRHKAGATWRVSFAILIPLVLYVLYYRVYVLKELKLLSTVKQRDGVKGMQACKFCLNSTECQHGAVL